VIVELRTDHPRGPALAARVRARARRHLRALGRDDAELSVLLAGDRTLRTLNRRWRAIDRATDVLSFPATEPAGAGPELGDLAISLDTAGRRAAAAGRTLLQEVDRYLVHGLLHLLGHDHEDAGEAGAMARAEDALLSAKGMVGAARGPARRRGGARPRAGRR
jgi:probable rRNA maturation factor